MGDTQPVRISHISPSLKWFFYWRNFMYVNGTPGVMSVHPTGTNSTMFTECCDVAICNDERKCPRCKRFVIGYNACSDNERGKIRWRYATSHWKRGK